MYAAAVIGSAVALDDGVGVCTAGAAVGASVGDGDGEGGGGGGVALASTSAAAFTAGDDVACATLPCPVANWLTTNAIPRTLIPSPTPTAALPIVCSAERASGESPTYAATGPAISSRERPFVSSASAHTLNAVTTSNTMNKANTPD